MNDLEAVRRLAGEPTDEDLSRAYHQLTRMRATPIRRRPRWLVPVTAAAVVAIFAVVSAILIPQMGRQAVQPGSSDPPVTDVDAVLADLAEKAYATPIPALRPGQYLYRRATWMTTREVKPGEELPDPMEYWTDPDDSVVVKVVENGVDAGPDEETLKHWRDDFAANGATWHRSTGSWLNAMPDDPAALAEKLREAPLTYSSSADPNEDAFSRIRAILERSQLAMQPRMRKAFLLALARLDGLTAHRIDVEGRSLIRIDLDIATEEGPSQIYFDPATGLAVGVGSDVVRPKNNPAGLFRRMWTQAIVDEVGQRP